MDTTANPEIVSEAPGEVSKPDMGISPIPIRVIEMPGRDLDQRLAKIDARLAALTRVVDLGLDKIARAIPDMAIGLASLMSAVNAEAAARKAPPPRRTRGDALRAVWDCLTTEPRRRQQIAADLRATAPWVVEGCLTGLWACLKDLVQVGAVMHTGLTSNVRYARVSGVDIDNAIMAIDRTAAALRGDDGRIGGLSHDPYRPTSPTRAIYDDTKATGDNVAQEGA